MKTIDWSLIRAGYKASFERNGLIALILIFIVAMFVIFNPGLVVCIILGCLALCLFHLPLIEMYTQSLYKEDKKDSK